MLVVKKFGGTSVGSVDRIIHVATLIAQEISLGNKVIAVVSAMSGETNKLIGLAESIQPIPNPRELDVITSSGEQVTAGLLALALQAKSIQAMSFLGWQIPIRTDDAYTKSRINSIDNSDSKSIQKSLINGITPVIAGFQGVDDSNSITTLGRGGSDTTAVAIAVAFQADECQIYTDVDGVYTADPRLVSNARKLDTISFEEMLEMASLGSKVLQIRSVELAKLYKMPIRVLSSFSHGTGTLILAEQEGDRMKKQEQSANKQLEHVSIAGIAHEKDEAQITICDINDKPGSAAMILSKISDNHIEVDMIVQNVSRQGKADFTFTVHKRDYQKAMKTLEGLVDQKICSTIEGNTKVAKVSLVGVGMRSHAGIASKMFRVLADKSINIMSIATSEIKISVLIHEDYLELAVRALHDAFCAEK
ncbi:MAG: aspartate kinase [Methylacidiphilales bacterium]|nr:aspartate kinase [Candidatus Methylacidiphilales bacterium]